MGVEAEDQAVRRGGVVVGTDGSAAANAAVREAAALAQARGVELHIVAAYGNKSRHEARALGLLQRVAADLGVAAEIGAAEIGAPSVHTHAVGRRPSQALCQIAERVGAATIVVGNRGCEDRLRMVQRPICERVRQRAACEVLVLDTSAHWRRRVDDPSLTALTRAEPTVVWIERPLLGLRLYVGGLRVHHGLVGELLTIDGLRRRTRFGLLELMVGAFLLSDDWRDFPFSLWE